MAAQICKSCGYVFLTHSTVLLDRSTPHQNPILTYPTWLVALGLRCVAGQEGLEEKALGLSYLLSECLLSPSGCQDARDQTLALTSQKRKRNKSSPNCGTFLNGLEEWPRAAGFVDILLPGNLPVPTEVQVQAPC